MTYDELRQECSRPLSIEGAPRPAGRTQIIVGGMGGSALPAYALRFFDPALPIATHRDYDLPEDAPEDALYVALSYSGNTAEALSFARAARERGLPLAVIASGGELLALAEEAGIPYVRVPGGMQPRNALFYSTRALAELMGRDALVAPLGGVSFDADALEREVRSLAGKLAGALPIIYASRRNGFLAYVSKINLNETAKMPAFANVFPELNHNEMQSFDSATPEDVAALARFVLLRDPSDDPRLAKRMDVFAELMRERGRQVVEVPLPDASRAEVFLRTWFLMHRTARALAEERGVDPDAVSFIEDFKKRIAA